MATIVTLELVIASLAVALVANEIFAWLKPLALGLLRLVVLLLPRGLRRRYAEEWRGYVEDLGNRGITAICWVLSFVVVAIRLSLTSRMTSWALYTEVGFTRRLLISFTQGHAWKSSRMSLLVWRERRRRERLRLRELKHHGDIDPRTGRVLGYDYSVSALTYYGVCIAWIMLLFAIGLLTIVAVIASLASGLRRRRRRRHA